MKKMLIDASGKKRIEKSITDNQLIGIEYDSDIFTLLISNMIVHGDGRTNLYFGDCFTEINDVKAKHKPTIGLLNPPYKTKATDIEEFEYILNNLDALTVGGTCIAIIPISCVIEKTEVAKNLRQRVLDKHTLEAVLSMPEELFHNSKVNTVTCAVIITAHKPHPKSKKTWFAYCRNDGFIKMKNKGRIDNNHTWEQIRSDWVKAYKNREVLDNFSVMREVAAKDEWCVEAYLETDYEKFTVEDYENTVKRFLMFNLMDLSALPEMEGEDENV
jgi:type I restriction-modification system DNA methylase subunit